MIRILHTSDWHLGKRLERFSRHDEQVAVLDEICEIADVENADVILVAGDLFDTFNPPAESLDLFYKALKKMARDGRRPVLAIAGNHDMPERIEAPDPLARECGILFAGFPESVIPAFSLGQSFSVTRSEPGFLEIQLPGKPLLRILLTPYANEIRLKKSIDAEDQEADLQQILATRWEYLSRHYCDDKGVNVLMAHLLFMPEGGEEPEEPEEERPINHIGGARAIFTRTIPHNVQYVALGHLHRKQLVGGAQCPVIYSGSPLSYSFAESGQQKQVVIAEIEPGKEASIRYRMLQQGRKLERKRFESLAGAESWLKLNPSCLVELTLATDNFLSGEARRQLHEIHDGIVAIIPEILPSESSEMEVRKDSPILESMPDLFMEYFRNRKGQEADEVIMNLFREINAEEEEL